MKAKRLWVHGWLALLLALCLVACGAGEAREEVAPTAGNANSAAVESPVPPSPTHAATSPQDESVVQEQDYTRFMEAQLAQINRAGEALAALSEPLGDDPSIGFDPTWREDILEQAQTIERHAQEIITYPDVPPAYTQTHARYAQAMTRMRDSMAMFQQGLATDDPELIMDSMAMLSDAGDLQEALVLAPDDEQPEPSPTGTPTALPAGMALHETDRFSLLIPETWEVLDPTDEDFAAAFDAVRAENPGMGEITLEDVANTDLFAMESEPESPEAVGANLTVQREPYRAAPPPDLEGVVEQMVSMVAGEYESIGGTVIEHDTELEIDGKASLHVVVEWEPLELPDGSTQISRLHQYIVLDERDLWILSYTISPAQDEVMRPVIRQSALSFHVTPGG